MPNESVERRLGELGIELPEPTTPLAAYVPTKRVGNLLYVSGQVPFRKGQLMATGRVGVEVPMEDAQECARQCVLNALAAARKTLGTLDRIEQVVRLGCWVACEAGFDKQPQVANGASELLAEIFGERGRHARAAVGAVALPLNVPVEIEFLFEVRPD